MLGVSSSLRQESGRAEVEAMLIRYAERSGLGFTTTCEVAVRKSQTALEAGHVVRIPLTAAASRVAW